MMFKRDLTHRVETRTPSSLTLGAVLCNSHPGNDSQLKHADLSLFSPNLFLVTSFPSSVNLGLVLYTH
jgi:hypothetical protein